MASLLFMLPLLGCYEFSLNGTEDMAAPATDTGGFDVTLEGLRIDVFPGSNLSAEGLPAQSFRDIGADGDWDVNLPLRDPVLVRGVLTGIDVNPTADVGVPGSQEVRVEGTFKAFVPSTPMAVSVGTDGDGEIRNVELVPNASYTIAWVPQDPAELPFYVSTDEVIEEDTDFSIALDYGLPLYGQLIAEGTPRSGSTVQAIDVATGIGGPIVEVDAQGRYMLRVYPGEYELRVRDPDITVPDQVLPVSVYSTEGTKQDIEYGTLETNTVDGNVRSVDGAPMKDTTVRFTALTIYGAPAGQLVYEATSNENGDYLARLVPGRYQVEYMPPAESEYGPIVTAEIEVQAVLQLSEVTLPLRPTVSTSLMGPDGLFIAGATVRAKELDLSGHVFETSTDEEGLFTLAVSDTTLAWTFVPPNDVVAAIGHAEATPGALDGGTISLNEGQLITGHVSYSDQGAPYTLIDVRDSEDRLYGSVLTDGEGNFVVRVDPDSVAR